MCFAFPPGPIVRDPPSFPRPGGHVRRVLSRTRGYVGLPADEAMGPRRPSRWEGTILWEPYLTSFDHTQVYEERNQDWPFVRAQQQENETNASRWPWQTGAIHGHMSSDIRWRKPIFLLANFFDITYSA